MARRPPAAGQAGRPDRPGPRGQQGPQARVPVRRRPRPWGGRAGHRGWAPVQPRPDDGGGRQPAGPGLPPGGGRTATPDAPAGNLLLSRLLGAELHFTGTRDYYAAEAAITDLAATLEAEGHKPYAIPIGGASVTGVQAYVAAAGELLGQLGDPPTGWWWPTARGVPMPGSSPAWAAGPGSSESTSAPGRTSTACPGPGHGRRPGRGPRRRAIRGDHRSRPLRDRLRPADRPPGGDPGRSPDGRPDPGPRLHREGDGRPHRLGPGGPVRHPGRWSSGTQGGAPAPLRAVVSRRRLAVHRSLAARAPVPLA